MVEILNASVIRISSEINEWMNCIFLVDKKNEIEAKEVLDKAWDDFWEEKEAWDWCYGDFLEERMKDSNIPYSVYYLD